MANELTGKARELANSGKYKEAIKILNSTEGSDAEYPSSLLLLLLCSYQVNTVEQLLKKATVNLKAVELFARRPELNKLAVILQSQKNDFVAHLMEYCYLAMILAGETDKSIRGQMERPVVTSNKRESAFSRMDKADEPELRRARLIEESEFDPIEELDDIGFRFRRGLENPDVSLLSAGASLAMDLFTFNSRAYTYNSTEINALDPYPDRVFKLRSKASASDENGEESPQEEAAPSGSRPESAFDNAGIKRAPYTDEERVTRMNELMVLINEEEKALLP